MMSVEDSLLQQVLDALRRDKYFRTHPEAFAQISPYVSQLITIIGDKIDDQATYEGVLKVDVDLIKYMLIEGFGKNLGDHGEYRERLRETMIHIRGELDTLPLLMEITGSTDRDLMMGPRLNARVRSLYASGRLTFRALILNQPGTFFPKLPG